MPAVAAGKSNFLQNINEIIAILSAFTKDSGKNINSWDCVFLTLRESFDFEVIWNCF